MTKSEIVEELKKRRAELARELAEVDAMLGAEAPTTLPANPPHWSTTWPYRPIWLVQPEYPYRDPYQTWITCDTNTGAMTKLIVSDCLD